MAEPRGLTRLISTWPDWAFDLFAVVAAFSTYFCMYAFRKPFAAAEFAGAEFAGTQVQLKTAMVISQIIGYAVSKYLGIKFCSEMLRRRRLLALVALILMSHLTLLWFAVAPPNLKVVAIFLNGLPLGMIWGLVVAYLEGRRSSELLLAGLSCSFVLASGFVKDVGRFLMQDFQVSEAWMPFATGALFLLPFLFAAWLLDQLPDPTPADEIARTRREPMFRERRREFLSRYFGGLILLLITYFFLTALRDFRDNYGIEMLREMGYAEIPAIFSKTELPVAFIVLLALAAVNLVKSNRWGLAAAFGVMITGTILLGVSTLLWDAGVITGITWMILTGTGAYLAYVPFGSVLFDRMLATTRFVGTSTFAIYVADALGYTGSVGVQIYKDLGAADTSRLEFFRWFSYAMAALGTVALSGSCLYFFFRAPESDDSPRAPRPAVR